MIREGDAYLGLKILLHCGRGAYGDVYFCQDISGKMLALKVIPKQKIGSRWERELKGITNYRQSFFYGTVYEESYQGLAYTFYGEEFDYDLVGFLPEATFTFQKDAPLRGDVNGDKRVTIADVTALISLVLSGEPAPSQADCNLDENINIGDVTALISYVLSGSW